MGRKFLSELQKYVKRNRNRRIWRNIVIVLACVVVFCTTYALILPAITVDKENAPGVINSVAEEGSTNETVEKDFTEWITSVTLENYSGGAVSQWDTLSFKIAYTVPESELSAENRTIVYTLPSNMKVTRDSSGAVYDGKTKVGEYSISKETGEITVIFDEDYAAENGNGKSIDGTIEFEALVSEMGSGQEDNIRLEFNDQNIINIPIDKQTQWLENDLKVKKEKSEIDGGIITYTITVSSKNGTKSGVILKDYMTNVVFGTGISGQSGFEIIRKNGDSSQTITLSNTQEEGSNTPKEGSKTFDFTLDPMKAGDEYIITYKAKIDDVVNGSIDIKNKVTVDSTNQNGEKIKWEDEVTSTFNNELIKKTGTYNEKDGMIEWTIDINKSEQDIGKWELSDKLNGVALPEDFKVTISPSPKDDSASLETSLPYTFPEGSNKHYTVTYRTEAIKGIEASKINNVAELKPSNGEDGYSSKKEVTIGSFNPLSKDVIGITEDNDDSKTDFIEADIEWKVTIDTTDGQIPAGWVLTDSLDSAQWLTQKQQEQIETIFEDLESKGYSNTLVWKTNSFWIDGVYKENVVVGFEVTFHDALEKGENIEFSYKSTGSLKDGFSDTYFNNNININNKVYSSKGIDYKAEPVVSKYDLEGNKTDNTNHNFNDIQGILGWGFTVDIPKRAEGNDIIITEKLPDGVSLLDNDGLNMIYNGHTYTFDFKNETSETNKAKIDMDEIDGNGNEIIAQKDNDNNQIIITIPKELTTGNQSKQFKFEVRTKIDDDYNGWQIVNYNNTGYFKNTVVVEIKNEDETKKQIGYDEQSQTITKEAEESQVLNKSHGTYEYNNIPYSIIVNENGEDLLEGSDTLILKDELKYGLHLVSGNVDISLKQGSLHVYEYENGQKGEELSSNDFQYVISESQDYTYKIKTLSITIPDEMPLLIEYEYEVGGDITYAFDVENIVSLEGESIDSSVSKDKINIQIDQSQATATMKGVNIYKVESSNYANTLQGAEFNLYRWDSNSNSYIKVKNKDDNTYIFKTDQKGKFTIDDIAYDTAYKLVEITAPQGYIIQNKEFEFYITENGSNLSNPPEGFNGTKYIGGSNIYIENKKDSTDITVEKKWFDKNGNEHQGEKPGVIKFYLYQKSTNTTTNEITTVPYRKTPYILDEQSNWRTVIKDLPKSDSSNGDIIEYSYYVVEDELQNYTTEYEYTVDGAISLESGRIEDKGILSGTITIKNKEDVKYVLPETGRFGGNLMFILGGGLLMAGSLIYIYRRKHNKGDVK